MKRMRRGSIWPALFHVVVDESPHAFRLGDMGIGIDDLVHICPPRLPVHAAQPSNGRNLTTKNPAWQSRNQMKRWVNHKGHEAHEGMI